MKTEIHPDTLKILELLFPGLGPEQAFNRISSSGKKCIEALNLIKNKKDADSSPAPSIQLKLNNGDKLTL